MTERPPLATDNFSLPEFDAPPIVETAIGVVFVPIEGWKQSHFARFGRQIEGLYATAEPQDRVITTQIEQFEPSNKPPMIELDTTATLWWYTDETGGRLIQLQRDRFVHNWRKSTGQAYPRYAQTREQFLNAWVSFQEFLVREGLQSPTVLQVEIDYVNHIEKGVVWKTAADLSRITPLLAKTQAPFLPEPEGLLLNARYLIPGTRGRIHVTLQPAIRNIDRIEVMQLTISARGRPTASDTGSIMELADLEHAWISRAFLDVTTAEVQEIWGRTK